MSEYTMYSEMSADAIGLRSIYRDNENRSFFKIERETSILMDSRYN